MSGELPPTDAIRKIASVSMLCEIIERLDEALGQAYNEFVGKSPERADEWLSVLNDCEELLEMDRPVFEQEKL